MSDADSSPPPHPPRSAGALAALDHWMAEHPVHPRLLPFLVYVLMLLVMGFAVEAAPRAWPVLYLVQCGLVLWLLARYWRLLPEITFSFHWLALPVAVLSVVAWVGLGMLVEQHLPLLTPREQAPDMIEQMGPAVGWPAAVLRLLGMSLLVPVFEELLFRSALLRCTYSPRMVGVAIVQWLEDIPLLGDRLRRTDLARRCAQVRRPMATAFEQTPLGRLSVFSVILGCVLWCLLSHLPRDWPGTIACALLWMPLLWHTNRGSRQMGLGPVIWAHGLTNALLWAWTIYADDWRFL